MGRGQENQKTKGKVEEETTQVGEEVESLIIAKQRTTIVGEQISKEKKRRVQVENA